MVLTDAQANFVWLAMLVAPLLWLAWNTVRSGTWRLGLGLMAGSAVLLFMGSILLAGRSHMSRTLYREAGRVAFVDHYEATLFDVSAEPVFLPEGAEVSVKESLVRSKKYPARPPSTFHVVQLGTASQTHAMGGSSNRADAEARAAELSAFMRGETSRLELPESQSGSRGVLLFMGGLAYSLGLAVSVLGGRALGGESSAAVSKPPPRGKKSSGPRSGRSHGRGWKQGR